jgi:FF domain
VAAYQQQMNEQPTAQPAPLSLPAQSHTPADYVTSSPSSSTDVADQVAVSEKPYATKQQRIQAFLGMLREKNISPASTWEKALPKLVFESRFRLLDSQSRLFTQRDCMSV